MGFTWVQSMKQTLTLSIVLILVVNTFFSKPVANANEVGKSSVEGDWFSIIILPDTQCYLAHVAPGTPQPEIFTRQTKWIVEQRKKLKVAFVLHEGDITQNNTADEWKHADASMAVLDGKIPYAMVSGNHDIEGNCQLGTRRSLFSQYFPPSRFASLVGNYRAEPKRSENTFHLFSAGGTDWLVICLEFGPRDPVLRWANEVASRYPKRRVIVLTHTYLFWNGRHQQAGDVASIGGKYRSLQELPGGANDGDQVWAKFVKRCPNVSFVFNGHVIDSPDSCQTGDNARLISRGEHGNKVYQVLTNFQSLYLPPPDGTYEGARSFTGGGGYLRIVSFYPMDRRVVFRTYSPYYRDYLSDGRNQFELRNVELGPVEVSRQAR